MDKVEDARWLKELAENSRYLQPESRERLDRIAHYLRAAPAPEARAASGLREWAKDIPCELCHGERTIESGGTPEANGERVPCPECCAPAANAIEAAIDEYLGDYTFEGDDGNYTPTETERFLMKDAIMGLLVDDEFIAASAPAPSPQPAAGVREEPMEEEAAVAGAMSDGRRYGLEEAAAILLKEADVVAARQKILNFARLISAGAASVASSHQPAGELPELSNEQKKACELEIATWHDDMHSLEDAAYRCMQLGIAIGRAQASAPIEACSEMVEAHGSPLFWIERAALMCETYANELREKDRSGAWRVAENCASTVRLLRAQARGEAKDAGRVMVPRTMTRQMVGHVVDVVFDGACEDASVIEDVWSAAIEAAMSATTAPGAGGERG